MKIVQNLTISLGLALPLISLGMNQAETKKTAAHDQRSLDEQADALAFGDTPLKQLNPSLRRLINEYAQGWEEIFTHDSCYSTDIAFGSDKHDKPFVCWDALAQDRSGIAYQTPLHSLNHIRKKPGCRARACIGNGKMITHPHEINIVDENGKSTQVVPANRNGSIISCFAKNTIAYTYQNRQLPKGRFRKENPYLTLEEEIDGVKIFYVAISSSKPFQLSSTIDANGHCWLASSNGALWNTENPEILQNFDIGFLPPVYVSEKRANFSNFLLTCDKENKLHVLQTSSSSPGKFYYIGLPEGKVKQTFQHSSEIHDLVVCDAETLATRSGDSHSAIQIWKIGSDTCQTIEIPHHLFRSLCASRCGQFIAATSFNKSQSGSGFKLHVWKNVTPYKLALEKLKANKEKKDAS